MFFEKTRKFNKIQRSKKKAVSTKNKKNKLLLQQELLTMLHSQLIETDGVEVVEIEVSSEVSADFLDILDDTVTSLYDVNQISETVYKFNAKQFEY